MAGSWEYIESAVADSYKRVTAVGSTWPELTAPLCKRYKMWNGVEDLAGCFEDSKETLCYIKRT
jgi:hypothetical protein